MYRLIFTNQALKSLRSISKTDARRIIEHLEVLSVEPNQNSGVKRLTNHPFAIFRLRVGDYRVLFDKDDFMRVIEVIDVGHRKNIYK